MERELLTFQQAKNTEKTKKGKRDIAFSQGNDWKCVFTNCNIPLEQQSRQPVNASP